jgi:hypothetical protein
MATVEMAISIVHHFMYKKKHNLFACDLFVNASSKFAIWLRNRAADSRKRNLPPAMSCAGQCALPDRRLVHHMLRMTADSILPWCML